MRIVIAFPPFLDPRVDPEDVLAPPIGVYYVAASLIEKGHEVRILNWFEVDKGFGKSSFHFTPIFSPGLP